MFEYTISANGNQNLINRIYNYLHKKFVGDRALIIREQVLNCHHISIAINDIKKDFALGVIIDAICDAIIFSYKFNFLDKHITNFSDEGERYKLIATLVNFDNQTDIQAIKQQINIGGNKVNITSLYHFKLQKLKNKWLEICKIINDNAPYISNSSALKEIFRAFDNENKRDFDVHIYANANNLNIVSKKSDVNLVFEYNHSHDEIISEIISINPKRVFFHGNLSKIKNIENVVSNIYPTIYVD